jgi:protein-arginine kinase activator protein McsA
MGRPHKIYCEDCKVEITDYKKTSKRLCKNCYKEREKKWRHNIYLKKGK